MISVAFQSSAAPNITVPFPASFPAINALAYTSYAPSVFSRLKDALLPIKDLPVSPATARAAISNPVVWKNEIPFSYPGKFFDKS